MSQPDVRMTWENLLFLHWRVPPERMRSLVPEEFEIDTFDGSAWVGLVPFEMTKTTFRGVPRLPGLSRFFECNVRTYVSHRGEPGVWFFSLDAQRRLPVMGGRWLWSLNYIHGDFDVARSGESTEYRLKRRQRGPWQPGETRIAWTRGRELPASEPGSLEYFLTERYRLYTKRRGRIMHGRIEHEPWPLREAKLESLEDTLIASAGIKLGREMPEPDHVMMSDALDVVGYKLERS